MSVIVALTSTSCGLIFPSNEESKSDINIEVSGNVNTKQRDRDSESSDEDGGLVSDKDGVTTNSSVENTEVADPPDEADSESDSAPVSEESGFSFGFESRLQALREQDGNWRAWMVPWDARNVKLEAVKGEDKRWCDALAVLQEAGYTYFLMFYAQPGIEDVLHSLEGFRTALEKVSSFTSLIPSSVPDFAVQFSALVDNLGSSDSIEYVESTTKALIEGIRPPITQLVEQYEYTCAGVPASLRP